eukprot:4317403-Amphidinium_carterae.1
MTTKVSSPVMWCPVRSQLSKMRASLSQWSCVRRSQLLGRMQSAPVALPRARPWAASRNSSTVSALAGCCLR